MLSKMAKSTKSRLKMEDISLELRIGMAKLFAIKPQTPIVVCNTFSKSHMTVSQSITAETEGSSHKVTDEEMVVFSSITSFS